MFSLDLRHSYLKNEISNPLLDFYEDFNKTTENIKQKIIDIFSKYKLDFFTWDHENINFDKFYLVYKF